jgi:hypothetical protein
MRLAGTALSIAAMLGLCACWNGKDQYRKYVDEGQARGVPIIVYDMTANNPSSYIPAALGIAFLNTQAKVIDSVSIELAICDTMGQSTRPVSLQLGGPFEPGASFVIAPMGPADAKGHQDHVIIPHSIVTSITVTDASGVRQFQGKQVVDMLDSKIANYCVGRAM